MALFRFHHYLSVEESVKSTIIIKSIEELSTAISKHVRSCLKNPENPTLFEVKIDKKQKFNKQRGWYEHNVLFRTSDPNVIVSDMRAFFCVGIISEPLDEWEKNIVL